MKKGQSIRFVLYVTLVHCVTYFICGVIFSQLMRYSYWWKQPVVCDYFRDFDGGSSAAGPFVQVIRGFLYGLILIPFKAFLKEKKLGWLWLWLLFVVIGIIGAPSAAPCSIEGVVYSKIPIAFHFIGFPELFSQTLLFSIYVHRHLNKDKVSKKKSRLTVAFILAMAVFMSYALFSIIFAIASDVPIESGSADIKVMGQFLAPVILVFICHLIKGIDIKVKIVGLYILSALSFFIYQAFVLKEAGFVFIMSAPLFAAFVYSILLLIIKKNQE